MNKQWAKGSFTIETAMIMGVVLLVIFSVLIGCRTVYNRVKIIAYQYENAVTGREHELVGLWGTLDEGVESIEMDVVESVKYLRKAQFIKEL